MSRTYLPTDQESHYRQDEIAHRSAAGSLLRATDRESVYQRVVEQAHDPSGATATLFVPAADHALLAVTGDGTANVPLVPFVRELAAHVAAALDGLGSDDETSLRQVAELQRQKAQLERRDAERQELVRVFVNGLRNPLSAANACVELRGVKTPTESRPTTDAARRDEENHDRR